MSRDKTVLAVILREIGILQDMTEGISKKQFLASEKDQRAAIMTLLNIGEKVKQLSSAFKSKHNEIQWKHISGLRDIVAHTYFKLDMEDIWNTIKISLPEFESQIINLLDN